MEASWAQTKSRDANLIWRHATTHCNNNVWKRASTLLCHAREFTFSTVAPVKKPLCTCCWTVESLRVQFGRKFVKFSSCGRTRANSLGLFDEPWKLRRYTNNPVLQTLDGGDRGQLTTRRLVKSKGGHTDTQRGTYRGTRIIR